MSRRGTLIFYASAYVSVRLCFRPPMFPSAYVSVRQRLCPPVSLPVCVYVRLYPCLSASLPVYVSVRLYPCQSASLPVSTLSTVAHQALFHRSLSNLSVFFVLLACPVLSFFPLSYLFIPLLPLFLFFSSSLIFSLPIPILLTLLVLPATHLFLSKTCIASILCEIATYPMQRHTLLS